MCTRLYIISRLYMWGIPVSNIRVYFTYIFILLLGTFLSFAHFPPRTPIRWLHLCFKIYTLLYFYVLFLHIYILSYYISQNIIILLCTLFQSLDFVALLLSSFACDSSSFGLELELFVDATLTDKCCFPVNLISLVK